MLTRSQLFALGSAVPVIGIYFRAAELLDSSANGGGPGSARARELLGSFEARKPGVIANVRRVQELLAALGASAGAPPRLPAEFDGWSRQVLEAVESRLNPEHIGLATFHLIGRSCGGALAAMNLAVYALALADAAPADASIGHALASLREELHRLARSVGGAAAMLETPAQSGALAALAGELDAAPLDGIANAQAAMKRCADRIAAIEALLAA